MYHSINNKLTTNKTINKIINKIMSTSTQHHKEKSSFDFLLKTDGIISGSECILINNLVRQMKDDKIKLIITPGILKVYDKKNIAIPTDPLIMMPYNFSDGLPDLKDLVEQVLRIMARRENYPISNKISKMDYLDQHKSSIKIMFEYDFNEKKFYKAHLVEEKGDIYLTVCYSDED